jgi:hypothetical protein
MPKRAEIGLTLFPVIAASLLTAAVASAQTTEPISIPEVLTRDLMQFKELYVAKQLSPIRAHGTGRAQIDQAAIDRARTDTEAEVRGSTIAKILRRDRDGDGRITADEIRRSRDFRTMESRQDRTPEQIEAQRSRHMETEMEADADKDGVMTLAEILAFANQKARGRAADSAAQISALLALDPNGDGVLTAVELETLALAIYARFDLNDNGMMDGEEVTAVRAAQTAAKTHAKATPTPSEIMNCALPPAAENAGVFIVGAAQGDSVSPVSVVGPDGVTSVANLIVEPGATPIYVVATAASAVVWRIEGAVARVDKMVVLPVGGKDGPGAGVVGLTSEKVTFLKPRRCLRPFVNPDGGDARRAMAIIQAALGKPVTAVIGARQLMHTALPSARIIDPATAWNSAKGHKVHPMKPPKGVDHQIWSRLTRGYPGGIAEFDANDVIAPGPAVAYEVLPSIAGLVDLMKQGAIRRRLEDGYLLIQKPIARYPFDLASLRMSVLLEKGIPEPAGGSDSLCVISEETGRPLRPSRSCSP